MTEKDRTHRWIPAILLAIIVCGTIPAFAHGDRVITHVVEWNRPNDTGYRTKIDIVNLGPYHRTIP